MGIWKEDGGGKNNSKKKNATGSMVPESLLHTDKRTHTYHIAVP